MWANTLTTDEVRETLRAADQLEVVPWASPLVNRTKSIVNRLRAGLIDRETYRANPLQASDMSFLFEIRYARELADAGLSARYEHGAGVGNTTVDFRVDIDPPWLIELVSLHESEAFKAASWKSGASAGFILSTSASNPRRSEEGETIKAQQRIGAKVFDSRQGPIKFPEPKGSMHMILVDARGFLGNGRGDEADWKQIAFGPHGLDPRLIKYWTNPTTGERAPIMGVFQPDCPLLEAPTLQARVHFVG